MHLAVVIPVFNEKKVIEGVIRSLPENLPGVEKISTIIVDDGSDDGSAELLHRLKSEKGKNFFLLEHLVNRGQGAAVETGIEAAKKLKVDAIITLDGDGQHSTSDIAALLQPIIHGEADIVNGSRFLKKQPIPLLRRLYNFNANLVTWIMSGIWLTDSQSGMRALGEKAIEEIEIYANGYEFCTEMIREASWYKLTVKEVPITVSYSEYSLHKGQNFATGLGTIAKLVIRSLMK